MEHIAKQYDPVDGEYGAIGEEHVLEWLNASGYEVTHLPHGTYRQDLLVQNEMETFYLEIEREKPERWPPGSDWRFSTVHIPPRRRKPGEKQLILSLRSDCQRGWVAFWYSLQQDRLVNCPNRYSEKELFYDVPVCEVLFLDTLQPLNEPIAVLNHRRIAELLGALPETLNGTRRAMELLGACPPYGFTEAEWRRWNTTAKTWARAGVWGMGNNCPVGQCEWSVVPVGRRTMDAPRDESGKSVRVTCQRCGRFYAYAFRNGEGYLIEGRILKES